ncbi:MAG: glycoside hydrolase family 9 protein [Cyanobacteria bacterium J06633_2]
MNRRFFILYGGWIIATVMLLLGFHTLLAPHTLASMRHGIVVNQVGYLPQAPKVALLINAPHGGNELAKLVNLTDGTTVQSSLPSPPVIDPESGDSLQTLDFSSVTQSGQYQWVYGSHQSVPFSIGETIFADTSNTLLRSFYLQRCGIELADPTTGIYHPPCHLADGLTAHSDQFHSAHTLISAAGGWHDAGDYGKYVATAAVTVGRLLSIYEQYPYQFWDGQLNIPESGNGWPDLLDEMKFGLDWMLRMQRADGAVYRKLSGAEWPIGLSPEDDNQVRYVYGISTPETAKFAGVMAMASRVYRPFNATLAQQYLEAAEKAWEFLVHQPQMQVDEYPEDNTGSGAYLISEWDREDTLRTDVDDRVWVASELFLTTGHETYETYFEKEFEEFEYGLFEWKDPSALGMVDYLMQAPNTERSTPIKERVRTKLLERADALLRTTKHNGYGLANTRFIWGSNKMVAEEGITLAYAYHLTGSPDYRKAAFTQLDYLLGRNPFNQTFITGIGTHPVRAVNHLFARARDILIPGLVVGGPNSDAQDGIAPADQGILSYLDSAESYATNEYAIDYNSSTIGLITLLQSISNNL